MSLHDRFEAVNDDYLKFDRVLNRRSNRPDLHAFILLEELQPGNNGDIVSAAGHDEIWLDIGDDITEALTDEQILELVRCGVRLDTDDNSLCMFV